MLRCLAALSLFILAPVQAAPASLEELIARHTEAIGGREAVERVKAVQVELTIVEPQFKVEGVYRADRQQRMRIDIYADGKRVFTEAYDGRGAWQMGADGAKQSVSAMGAAALRNGVLLPGKLFGLHEQQSIGNRLELLGRERVDDIHYHVIGVTTATSDHIRLYINPSNWLIERTRVRKALHPDVDPTVKWLETRFSDFRATAGVLRPYQSVEVDLESGAVVQSTSVKEIITNPALEPDLFIAAPAVGGLVGTDPGSFF